MKLTLLAIIVSSLISGKLLGGFLREALNSNFMRIWFRIGTFSGILVGESNNSLKMLLNLKTGALLITLLGKILEMSITMQSLSNISHHSLLFLKWLKSKKNSLRVFMEEEDLKVKFYQILTLSNKKKLKIMFS